MKKRKTIFLCALSAVLCCPCGLKVNAVSSVDSGKLKSGLLLNERNNYQYNIYEYDTNDNQQVNVLDLCRARSADIEKYKREKQEINLTFSNPWISGNYSTVTMPVRIKGNTAGVSALSLSVGYDNRYFRLYDVYSYSGKVLFSDISNMIQFTTYDGGNLTNEGELIYMVFRTADEVPYEVYDFSLNEIQGTVLENGVNRELTDDECSSSAHFRYAFSKMNGVPSETTMPSETTPDITTTVTTATTTTALPETEPPVQDKLSFSLKNAVSEPDGLRLRIPVYMDDNTTGICSFNTKVRYDSNVFTLTGVTQGDFSGYGYVGGNRDNAVFNTFNSQNINDRSGIIAYLEFEINDTNISGTYEFELTDIYAYYSENWSQQEVPRDKRNDRSDIYRYSREGAQITTTPEPWTPPVTTTTVTEPWIPPVTTTTVTEPWAPPVTTTTVTEPWIPPVTTTTERPVEPPVTTTDPGSTPGLNPEKSPEEMELLNLILEYRRSLGLSELQGDDILFYCCDIRAEELTRSYGSERPDGSSRADLLKEYGSDGWIGSCEIRTKGTNDANTVLSRIKNIMSSNPDKYVGNPEYRYIGVGCYDGYWSIIITE